MEKLKYITGYIPEEKQLEFKNEMEEILNSLQEEAFMEGYHYAIQILRDSVGKKSFT